LQRPFIEKRLLYSMELITASQTLNSSNFPLANRSRPRHAGTLGPSVDQNRASATLSLSASILGSRQVKVLAQHSKKAGLRVSVNRESTPIDRKMNSSHGDTPD